MNGNEQMEAKTPTFYAEKTGPKIFPLSAVTKRIKEVLLDVGEKCFWVKGHLIVAKGGGVKGGHFYGEMVEYTNGKQIAKLRVNMWRPQYEKVVEKLLRSGVANPLGENSEVCLLASVRYHEVFGIGLLIHDVDPYFGESEINRNRRLIIEALTAENILQKNRKLPIPLLPKRIGLITSHDSAAHKDFEKTLSTSPYAFYIIIAQAAMQGENTRSDVLCAFDLLLQANVDLICIVRGGGSPADLAWFDDLEISRKLCLCKKPVWVGIGHEIDYGVLDVVANRSFKTPTAVAEALVDIFRELKRSLETNSVRLQDGVERRLMMADRTVANSINQLEQGLKNYFRSWYKTVVHKSQILSRVFALQFQTKDHQLAMWEKMLFDKVAGKIEGKINALRLSFQRLQLSRYLGLIEVVRNNLGEKIKRLKALTPESVLARGYCLTMNPHGDIVTSVKMLQAGDDIKTKFCDGIIRSSITQKEEENGHKKKDGQFDF